MACKFREDDIRVLEGGVPIQSDDVTPALDGSFLYWKSFKFPYTAENGDLKLAGISIDVTSDVMGKRRTRRCHAGEKSSHQPA